MTAAPPAGSAGPRPSIRREINPRFFWGIVGALALVGLAAIGALLVRRSSEASKSPPVDEARAREVSERRKMMEEGNRLVAAGQYEEALRNYRELVRRAPDSSAAREAVQKTEVLLSGKVQEDARTAELQGHLAAARNAEASGDDALVLAETSALLSADPGSAEAQALRTAAQERIAKKSAAEQRKIAEEAKRRKAKATPVPTAAPAVVVRPTAPPAAPVATPAVATLRISFDSPIPAAYVMVRLNDKEIFRKTFDFGKKSAGGPVEGTVEVPSGKAEFKVWVISPDRAVNQYLPVILTVPGGESRTLRLELDASRKLSVTLR